MSHTKGQPHSAAACQGARCTLTQGSRQVPQKPQSLSYVPLDVARSTLDLTFSSDELLMSESHVCPCGALQTVEWPTSTVPWTVKSDTTFAFKHQLKALK